MPDWRPHTGTKTLQLAWSLLVLAAGGVALAVGPPGVATPVLVGGGALWLAGLLALGWRERRRWQRLVATSAFEAGGPGATADLQRIVSGHSVTVSTDVPGLLAGTHTVVTAGVTGVDARFTVELAHVCDGATNEGLTTGNEAIDESWVVEGAPKNVRLLLTPDVQSALMDVSVPGTATVTGERVAFRIPFTALTADELAACARAVAAVADRLERVGRGDRSPTG